MKTTAELKAIYGDPLTYYVIESRYEHVEGNVWVRRISKVKTTDDAVHDVDWADRGHTDEHNKFIHEEWLGEVDQHFEQGPFA